MVVRIKTEEEISIMRKGGKILANIFREVIASTKEGISTYKLDQLTYDLCKKNKVEPAFLGYRDYPSVGCFGVNDTVVHGIPSKTEILKSGDIVSIDIGIIYRNFYVDRAVTVGVGKISVETESFIQTTRNCLYFAIKQTRDGNHIGDLGNAIETVAKSRGFSVVKEMVGHGIGRDLHEEPQIPGFGNPGEGVELKEGMTLAIEAIINQGDGKLSALYEHTVVIREDGAEILTI
jgi:methionyl aminopeptidase